MNKKSIFLNAFLDGVITPRRMLNASKAYLSFLLKKEVSYGYPFAIMIEPTNFCNLKCPLCPTGNGTLTAPRGNMKFEDFKKIIDDFGDYVMHLTLWNFGEPFLNKETYKMIEYAKKKRIFVRVSTNGTLLNNEENIKKIVNSGLDNLIVAIDGASEKTFLKYRKGGTFKSMLEGLRKLMKSKKRKPYVEIQFIVMKHNQHEVPIIKKLAKELKVDKLTLKTVTLDIDQKDKKQEEFVPTIDKYSRYKKESGKLTRKDKIKDQCLRLWVSTVINWDGSIVPCCYDPNRKFYFGNIFEEKSFKKIWNNKKYREFRKAVLKNKKQINMCKNCTGNLTGLNLN